MAGGSQKRGGHGSGDPCPDDGDVDFDGHLRTLARVGAACLRSTGTDEHGRLGETTRAAQ